MSTSPAGAPVWGRDDLTCPVPWTRIRRLIRQAKAAPWPGRGLVDPRHFLDTTAITEPGRPVRVLLTLDYGHHTSGWWANSEYDRCFHLSVSHPRHDLAVVRQMPTAVGAGQVPGVGVEAPSDDEVRAWGRVFFREHVAKSWLEPAAGPLDRYRTAGVTHLRLFLDQADEPIQPRGEVYHLRPFGDGSSPAKVREGRAGGDVR